MKKGLFSILLLTLFFSACSGKKEKELTKDEQLRSEAADIKAYGKTLKIERFNKLIMEAQGGKMRWAYSPIGIALTFVGENMISPQMSLDAYSMSGKELVTEVMVIIRKNDLPDDAIKNEKWAIHLSLGGSIWQIDSAYKTVSCRRSEHPEEYQPEPCP